MQHRLKPGLDARLAVEPEVHAVGADGRSNAHPDQIGVFAVARRDAVREQQAPVGDVGEPDAVLAVQAFDLAQRARAGRRGRELGQRGDGDRRGGVRDALRWLRRVSAVLQGGVGA